MFQEINFKNIEKNFEKGRHTQHIERVFEENLEDEYLNVKNMKSDFVEEPEYSDDSESSDSDSDSSDSSSESSDSESSDSDSSESESDPNETDSHDSYQFQGLGY